MPTLKKALAAGFACHQGGQLADAERLYRQVLALDPNQADAWHLLGLVAYQSGRNEIAIDSIRRAIALNGDQSDYFNNLGNALKVAGKWDEAIACFRRALEIKPDSVEIHNELGNVLKEQGLLQEALDCYYRALELNPDLAEVHNNLGNALIGQGKLNEAFESYRRALELKPDYPEALNNLGNAYNEAERPDEAAACCIRALDLKPDYVEAHYNLGLAFQGQEKLPEAAACFRRALELKPDLSQACVNLGVVLQLQLKLDEAAESFQQAIDLKPDYGLARSNQALLRLLTGDFLRGWPAYQWKNSDFRRFPLAQPQWEGDLLHERTIFLHAEQGLGDTLQFVRYVEVVKKQNPRATIVMECQRPLAKLLKTCGGIDQLIARDDQTPAFDVHIPLDSLPGIFKTTLETIPANVPYVCADEKLVAQWRERLCQIGGIRIGINWRGQTGKGDIRKRDIPLSYFAELARIPGVRLICLQKGAERDELRRAGIWDAGEDCDVTAGAFMDTAAIMKNLDLVISSDTSVPHLAGALGVPVWVALPFAPDWRWLLDRSDSPWYPTMRLFRQKEPGDWAGVFKQIEAELRERVAS